MHATIRGTFTVHATPHSGTFTVQEKTMFGTPIDNPDVLCPECRRPMVDMIRYERAIDSDFNLDGDLNPFTRVGRAFFFFELINVAFDRIYSAIHKRKARRICEEILPQHPKSLICAGCLFYLKRQ